MPLEDTLNPADKAVHDRGLQRLQPRRRDKELFIARKCQLRRRRRGAWRRWQALIIEVLSDS